MEAKVEGINDIEVITQMTRDDGYKIVTDDIDGEQLVLIDCESGESLASEVMVHQALELKNKMLSDFVKNRKRIFWKNAYVNRVYGYVVDGGFTDEHFNYLTLLLAAAIRVVAKRQAEAFKARNRPLSRMEVCEAVLDEILALSKQKQFAKLHNNAKQRVKANLLSASKLFDALMDRYSKILVERVDLYLTAEYLKKRELELQEVYRAENAQPLKAELQRLEEMYITKGCAPDYAKSNAKSAMILREKEYVHALLREDIREYFSQFKNNFRHNDLFTHVVGYFAKIEFGQSRGHHIHMILLMNGQMVNRDAFIADEIGHYWRNVITSEKDDDGNSKSFGAFFNCNKKAFDNKIYGYKQVGIGMIEHSDAEKRKIFVTKVLTYLCKAEQFGRTDRSGKKFRLFSRSEMPRQRKATRLGRPRNQTVGDKGAV